MRNDVYKQQRETGIKTTKKSTVAVVRCDSYNRDHIDEAVKRGIALLGGIERFFKKSERIVLKPNVLAGIDPNQCATTHPAVFEGIIKELQALGVNLYYGDSPGMGTAEQSLKKAGFTEIADRYGVVRADFVHSRKVHHPKALVRTSFPLAEGVLESDGLVSLSKLKTHGLVRLTGALKNQYGCIPGLTKAKYHAENSFINDFCGFLADITSFIKPRLYVMDAVMAMEGNGPSSGDPKKIGCLLFSDDPVALDAVACRIVAINPEFVPTCRAGNKAGLGNYKEEYIDIVGDSVEQFIDTSFKIVRKPAVSIKGKGMKAVAHAYLLPKPCIDPHRCIQCGKCVAICPVEPKAVQWQTEDKNRSSVPQYTYLRCIRCFCCQETCPAKAITIQTSRLNFLLSIFTFSNIIEGGIRFVIRRIKRSVSGSTRRK